MGVLRVSESGRRESETINDKEEEASVFRFYAVEIAGPV